MTQGSLSTPNTVHGHLMTVAAGTRTIAVGVWEGMAVNQLTFNVLAWPSLNAAGTLAYVPAIIVMFGIRKYLAKGFSLGLAR